jgi:nucleoside-diphosphate-sugar epimerase
LVWQLGTKEGTNVRILVTGGTGHLGRDIVSILKDQGHHVRVLARTPGQDPAVEWIQGDLATGRGITEAVSGTEVILHAATFSPAARRGTIRPVDLVRSPVHAENVVRPARGPCGALVADLVLFASVVHCHRRW